MSRPPINVAVVGQGPNQTAWKHGLALGVHYRSKYPGPYTDRVDVEGIAERYCARVAITGRVGETLAELAWMHRLEFYRSVGRFNLNARWNGKCGKADVFNREEAALKAARLVAESFTYYVLLGHEVARAFGVRGDILETKFDPVHSKNYLLFPHPSGINLFWNEPFNVHRAGKRLREFLEDARRRAATKP